MRAEDFIAKDACSCPDCFQAGIAGETPIRDYRSGKWLHGYDLKRLLEARAKFFAMRDTIKPKEMP